MAFRRRRTRRRRYRVYRTRRRPARYRPFRWFKTWRRNRGRSATRSKMIKLSTPIQEWTMTDAASVAGRPVPFLFSPAQVEGFMEYAPVYSEFRILKAKLEIVETGIYTYPSSTTTQQSLQWGDVTGTPFAVVSSQPFTTNYAVVNAQPQPVIQNLTINALCAKDPDQLLQSRWARLRKPRTTDTGITIGFYPYQLTWAAHGITTAGGANNGYVEQRSGRRWMPMSFFGATIDQSNPADDVVFIGPYIPTKHYASRRTVGGELVTQDWPVNAIRARLTLYMQFRGQK